MHCQLLNMNLGLSKNSVILINVVAKLVSTDGVNDFALFLYFVLKDFAVKLLLSEAHKLPRLCYSSA